MTPTGNRIVTFEKPLEMKVNTFKFPELITPQGKSAPHVRISEHRDRPFRLIVTGHFANA